MTADPAELHAALEAARTEGARRIAEARDLGALEEARVRVLGRKAPLSRARGALGAVAPEQRKELGRLANEVASELEAALARRSEALEAAARRERWQRERIDVTLPGDAPAVGGVHPLTRTVWRIVDIFVGLGYRLAEGPEVELSTYTFDALRIPVQHPSRSPQDTFYVAGAGEDVCLRPHTSPVQIRAMEASPPPLYVVAPGRCYRRDEQDATHLAGFTQIEALAVDEGITMADLKGTLSAFAGELFGRDLDVRLRPSFFPFTEPSAEMDVQCFVCRGGGCNVCKGEGWIEVLGCGMVHPHLFEWVGYDPERYSGFALGMGVERVASLAHGVSDIRAFWDDDVRFLERFGGVA